MQQLKAKVQAKESEITQLRQRLGAHEQLSDRVNTQESGHSEPPSQNVSQKAGESGSEKPRKTTGVDQDMVDFFGGGAGGAKTEGEANEEVETLRQQCEDYEQDINYL